MSDEKRYTFEDLLRDVQALTPEQRQCPVVVSGEETAETVIQLWIADEDLIDPTGEGGESAAEYRKVLIAQDGLSEAEADAEMEKHKVVLKAGTPLLWID